MAAGETGAVRATGEKGGDAFVKREKANEDMWVKAEEQVKLEQLQDRLLKQKQHIEKLSKNIDDLFKNSK